tara:strand:+ start:221 stop:532 length:312 start_codon:yes stop_codon:yes gene_type:complete
MLRTKFIISSIIFITFLIITSAVKNETRILEKKITNLSNDILLKKKDINETQLDFYYLSSPKEVEKKLNIIGFNDYSPISNSKIFLNISDFTKINNKISNLKK